MFRLLSRDTVSQQQATSAELATFTIDAEAETATKTRVQTRGFEFVIDEPETLGGEDAAPTPVEYLIGAWAGCLNVVAHKVANERDIEIRDLEIDIAGDLDPRRFLGQSANPRAGYQTLQVELNVDTDADAATLDEWLGAVEARCPISDNLVNPTPTDITVSLQ